MLSLVALVVLLQVPCAPGEGSVACQCKQGVASACQVVRDTDPRTWERIEQALEDAANVARVVGARDQEAAQALEEARIDALPDAPEPPDCKGQEHHVISKKIAKALSRKPSLKGRYTPRDPRFVAKAKDEQAHCGYQGWHRALDDEIALWLDAQSDATPRQFEEYLRALYRRPELLARFRSGF